MNKSQQRTNCLLTPVHGLSCYDPLINDLNAHRVCSVYGMDDSQRAHFLSALARDTGRGMIILVPNDQAAMRMREDMDVLTGGRARMLPPRDISFVRSAASSRDLAMRRVEVLGACVGGDADVLIVPVDAALHRLDRPEVFRENTIALDESAQMEPSDLIEKLTRAATSACRSWKRADNARCAAALWTCIPWASRTRCASNFSMMKSIRSEASM